MSTKTKSLSWTSCTRLKAFTVAGMKVRPPAYSCLLLCDSASHPLVAVLRLCISALYCAAYAVGVHKCLGEDSCYLISPHLHTEQMLELYVC